MAEVVVERPETIFIGTANQVAKGVEHVWRYKLTHVGAERMYVCMEPPSTTHAGDLMFIMEEVVEGNKWYVAYEADQADISPMDAAACLSSSRKEHRDQSPSH